ncbi:MULTISPECIES: accessory Sec system glycosyltransferase GtfA [unclassified Streptococcus]|uniref:accessory Sec system glycosyltransferase GtfA n=1 Tax=unclassified Streptococcus TaxID=2608887 RepID=UPI001071A556|nr:MULTISPECIES: accessory Sec system glycosyltransferase GtfA [unclassified Streptococcus]MBF0787139.1 accessory Sec system glycosyltransferase GtfA [Streptococcus sp. 19428wC2_LYSM12]MCQ9212144.1 accessory Sec system glycosyltransferase GtfA [Streptococcus sp. B01]MCQ9213473.1 accessory Sec system glycosyltransferase GtfA [Streptococcus sp. O1]TFV05897.1 accessory Sec system glycosyltransferase GtfA [Streptococcus sp. LYSM12]
MTVYNINLGIGWASSGVEYAQAYRATVLRELGIPAKFIFTDMFQSENLQHFTNNIGFQDEEIIWLYGFFTDIKVAPTTYTRDQLEATFSRPIKKIETGHQLIRYYFEGQDLYVNAAVCGEEHQYVQRVEYVAKGKLLRKDYYSYTKIFSEYYTPKDDTPQLYQRSFFNEDGSVAYEEIQQGNTSMFCFKDRICQSKEDLIATMLEKLELTSKDILLLDRSTGIGQAVLQHRGAAKLGVVIHAEHFSVAGTNEQHILWNNYYEYQFTNADKIDAFIVSTQGQKEVLAQQFRTYTSYSPKIYVIPVGSLEVLRQPERTRKRYALITGSRLASEKHIDWLVQAVILARKSLPELTFDIYGEGGERHKLMQLIQDYQAEDYIQLKGHQNLSEIYKDYELYLTASTSEGFGLTLMEAVGSGLPLIGLDVPYGNQTFVENGKNGYLIKRQEPDDSQKMSLAFAEKICRYYSEMNQEQAQAASYKVAESFLHQRLEERWTQFVKEMSDDSLI